MISFATLNDASQNTEQFEVICKQICEDIINHKYDISTYIESLGQALTSPDVEIRVKGTQFLSIIMCKLPADCLTSDQLKFIVTFYCDRMKDNHNVIPPILDGISGLIEMDNLAEGSVTNILTNFFQHIVCQSQVREDRAKIFSIIKRISGKYCNELKAMGADFIYGIINAIDGERDPRNLDYLFTFIPTFVQTFPLYHLAEEFFETFACYFPIDFQPSKADSQTISRDTLADKLANCLVANDEFSEFAIALLLEKLESDLIVAKLDSLDLLSRCAVNFKPEVIESHFDQIWVQLKNEILPGSDNKNIINAGLAALKVVLTRASENKEISKNMQTRVLSNILPHLSNTNHRLFGPSSAIAIVCCSGDSLFASKKILSTLSLTIQTIECTTEEKVPLFYIISEILKVTLDKSASNEINEEDLQDIRTQLVEGIKLKTHNSLPLIKAAASGIQVSLKIFSPNERKDILATLLNLLTNKNIDLDLGGIIREFGIQYPEELSTNFVDILSDRFDYFSPQVQQKIFKNLLTLATFTNFEDKILHMLMDNIYETNTTTQREIAVTALQSLLRSDISNDFIQRVWTNYSVLAKTIYLVQQESESFNLLNQIAIVMSLFIRKLTTNEQQEIVDKFFLNIKITNPADLFLTKGILGHMHENVNMNDHFEYVFESIVQICLENDNTAVREVGHALLCSLVNKIKENQGNNTVIRKCVEKLKHELKNGKSRAIHVLAWIAKGLIVRGHPEAEGIIDALADLLDHPSYSSVTEVAFEIISAEIPELHLPIVKFLFKQKFFHTILNKLWHKLNTFEENHINAFAHVLAMTPQRILQMNLEKVAPIIFKCLEGKKVSTIQIGLDTVKLFLQSQDDYFRNHLSHLIKQLIRLAGNQSSMKIRITALECLEITCKYPTHVLVPFKTDVVLGLAATLDDRKRFVRNAAVKARNSWYLIGSDTK